MMPFRQSLVFRIFVISFILLALPLLVDSFIIIQQRYDQTIKNAKEFLIKVPDSRAFVLSRILQVRRQAIAFAEYFLDIKGKFPTEPSAELNQKMKELAKAGDFEDVLLVKIGSSGEMSVIASSFDEDSKTSDFHSYKFYETIAAREYDTGGSFSLLFDYPASTHHLLFGQVVYGSDGKTPVGVLIFLTDISARLKDVLSPSHGTIDMNYALMTSSLLVIAADDPTLQFQYFFPLSQEKLKQIKEEQPFSAHAIKDAPLKLSYAFGAPYLEFEWGNQTQIGVITSIQDTDFFLLSYTPKELLFTSPLISFLDIYIAFGLILTLGGYLAYMASRRISRPFRKLSGVMEGIQQGDLSQRYVTDPLGFEINTLGLSFNEMIDTVLEKKFLAEEERVRVEIYESELRIGQQVQRGLLPTKMPTVAGIEIAERYLPAKEVAGDFYDVFLRDVGGKEKIALIVADASGKGVQACFYSLGVRSNVRVYAREFEDAGVAMKNVNRLFYYDSGDTGMFVTLLLGIFDPKTGELEYCSCGHNAPYVRKADGTIEVLGGVEMALGVKKEIEATTRRATLQSGDLLVFYTDGVTEAHNEKNELFSEERLMEFLRKKGNLPAESVATELINEVKEFQGEAKQHDDITLLLLKML